MPLASHPFLSHSNNLSPMLNIDWFNPYEETPYSAGVIYFVVQNLPRAERFKFENILLVGIIPGPNEPKKHMVCPRMYSVYSAMANLTNLLEPLHMRMCILINTFLTPIVKEL